MLQPVIVLFMMKAVVIAAVLLSKVSILFDNELSDSRINTVYVELLVSRIFDDSL